MDRAAAPLQSMLSLPVYFKAFEREIISLVLAYFSLFLNVLWWVVFEGGAGGTDLTA